MSKLLRLGLCALALFTLPGCQKFSKSFQEKAFTCGLQPDQYQNPAHLLQIVDADQQPLSAARLQTLQVGLRHDGQWQNLQLSRGGCVVVEPQSQAEIIAQDPVHDAGAYLALDQLENGFSHLPLKKRRSFSMRFSCPAAAYAADDQLPLNAFYAGDGEAKAGLWLRFAAQKMETDEPAHILWNAALDREAFPETLSMQNLPEGAYKLTARAGYLKPGQDPRDLDILGEGEGCLLNIMRGIPDAPRWRLAAHMSGASDLPPDLVVAVQQPLDLIKAPDTQLEYCLENSRGPFLKCEAQTNCHGAEANFMKAESISLPNAGEWAVFVRNRDAAGHVSPISCARVQVSDSAPSFSVNWKEAEWNQPFPLVALPPLTLEAQVTDLKHETVGVQYLEESLECRVTVTSALGNSRDAYYSRCLSGRCQGRAFRDWQPCSRDITIDMSQEWLRSENWESSVSLHVRASDQAGHARVLRKNLWFSGQRLLNKSIPHPVTQDVISSSQLFKRNDGTILATADGFLLQDGAKGFTADPAIGPMLGSRPVRQLKVFEDPHGVALWGFWTFHDEGGPVLGKKAGEKWIFQPNADQGAPAQSCENFGQNHQGILLCLNSKALARMDAQHRWQSFPFGDASGNNAPCETSAPLNSRYTEDKNGRWFLCDSQTLLFQAQGQTSWQKMINTPSYLVNIRNILKARSGELWILGDEGSSTSKVYAWTQGEWEDRSEGLDEPWYIREDENALSDLENFHELADGSLRFGVQIYDSSEKKWRSMLPDALQKYEGVAQDADGGLWTVVEEKALLRFYPKPLILPLEMLGLLPGSRLVSLTTKGSSVAASFLQTGHILYRGSAGLFHLESQPWQNLPFGFVRTPAYGEAWTQWFKDRDGKTLVLREDGEIARLDPEQGWTVVSLPSDRPPSLKKNFTLLPEAKHFLAQVETGLIWLWDLVNFREYPLQNSDGVQHDLRSAEVDGLGQVWEAKQGWEEPLRLYRLKDQTWEPYPVPDLPDSCSGPLIFFEGDNILLSCGAQGPAIVQGQRVTFLRSFYPELPWTQQNFRYWTVPTSDKRSPFIFFTVYDDERQEQTLHRFEPGTGAKEKWKLIDDHRLHFRGDILTPEVRFDRLAIDPKSPDRFLIASFRFILRPEGDTLQVAVDGRKLLATRGIKEEPMSGIILGLNIERFGEVWILMKELGLVRYDAIWQAEDKDENPVPRF